MVQNKLMLYFEKRETSLIFLFVSATFSSTFLFGQKFFLAPFENFGKNAPTMYCVFIALYAFSMIINGLYAFKAFELKDRILSLLAFMMNLGALFTSTAVTYPPELQLLGSYALGAHRFFLFSSVALNYLCLWYIASNVASVYERKTFKFLKIVYLIFFFFCVVGFLITAFWKSEGIIQSTFFLFLSVLALYPFAFLINHTDIALSRQERDERERMIFPADQSNLVAFGFGLLIFTWCLFTTFFFCRSPLYYNFTMVGVQYPVYYSLTCLCLGACFVFNFYLMFRRHENVSAILKVLAYASSAGMFVCALGISPFGIDLSRTNMFCSIVFFTATLFVLTFYTIVESKSNSYYGTFAIILWSVFVAVNAALILLYYVYKRRYGVTGLTELIPVQVMLLYFYLENYEDYFILGERSSVVNSKMKDKEKNIL